MELIPILIFISLLIFYLILKYLLRLSIHSRPISDKVKEKADRKFYKLLNQFKHKNKRNPDKNELFRIIINASHITIRRRGGKGHWGRQKVRKYLLEKHQVVKKYKMR